MIRFHQVYINFGGFFIILFFLMFFISMNRHFNFRSFTELSGKLTFDCYGANMLLQISNTDENETCMGQLTIEKQTIFV